jgi:choice-of-anchor A domain-containing protein
MIFMAMVALIVGSGLVYFLINSSQESVLVDRSHDWNSAMILAEAGIEEGMALVNNSGWPNNTTYSSDGWTYSAADNVFSITRTLRSAIGSYTVYVTNRLGGPTILSVGNAISNDSGLNSNSVRRAVLITTTTSNPFLGALTMQKGVDMHSQNITVDSYDSTDPYHSYWPGYPNGLGYGVYTNTGSTANSVRKANGNVATDGTVVGVISVGNGQIYGIVNTGPGGTTQLGSQGSVGDISWVDSGTQGIKSGYSRDDMNVVFTDVTLPSTNWTALANNTSITNSGNYSMNQITGNMTISATNVTLYLTNGINFSGNRTLNITSNASVTIYAGGTIDDGGNGLINNSSQHPSQLVVWGLPSLTSITLHGNGAFWGAVYAPEAVVNFKGAGNSGGFYGALMAYSITLTGNSTFSYDESLKNLFGGTWVVNSWKEVTAN